MLHDLLIISDEAAKAAAALMDHFRLLLDDAALSEFYRGPRFAELRVLSQRLGTFVTAHSASIPAVLAPALRCGGHFDPLLLLLEEAAQSDPFHEGTWPQYLEQAEKLTKKIANDAALIRRTLEGVDF